MVGTEHEQMQVQETIRNQICYNHQIVIKFASQLRSENFYNVCRIAEYQGDSYQDHLQCNISNEMRSHSRPKSVIENMADCDVKRVTVPYFFRMIADQKNSPKLFSPLFPLDHCLNFQ